MTSFLRSQLRLSQHHLCYFWHGSLQYWSSSSITCSRTQQTAGYGTSATTRDFTDDASRPHTTIDDRPCFLNWKTATSRIIRLHNNCINSNVDICVFILYWMHQKYLRDSFLLSWKDGVSLIRELCSLVIPYFEEWWQKLLFTMHINAA